MQASVCVCACVLSHGSPGQTGMSARVAFHLPRPAHRQHWGGVERALCTGKMHMWEGCSRYRSVTPGSINDDIQRGDSNRGSSCGGSVAHRCVAAAGAGKESISECCTAGEKRMQPSAAHGTTCGLSLTVSEPSQL